MEADVMNIYCVYVHRRADNGKIFYVGKGKPERARSKQGRSEYWNRIVNKYGYTIQIIKDKMPESCAFSLEKALIHAIGRENLCNMTDGGEGKSGIVPSDEQRRKCSISNKGTKPAPHSIEMARIKNSKPIGTRCGLRFDSAMQAARKFNPNNPQAGKVCISSSAIGKTKTAYRYEWGYLVDGEPQFLYVNRMSDPRPIRRKAVTCSNGMRFDGVSVAVEWLHEQGFAKASTGSICRAAKLNKSAYGFRWKYAT